MELSIPKREERAWLYLRPTELELIERAAVAAQKQRGVYIRDVVLADARRRLGEAAPVR